MNTLLAIAKGILFAGAVYLLLRRSLVQILLGLGLLTHAANLLVFSASGVTRSHPPLVNEQSQAGLQADPIPQALVLTAIVIGFGLQAFALILAFRTYKTTGSDDIDELQNTDSLSG